MSLLVEMVGINKSFGATKVLSDVRFSLEPGSVHALMGENGAGKSTLMRILSGVYQPNSGTVRLRGEDVNFRSPKEARLAGVSTVFQEFTLIPNLTVAENMFLSHEPRRADGSIDRAAVIERSRRLLADVFPQLDPMAIVDTLTVAQQQAVEIAKGLTSNADVFIFDEPTAALNSADVQHLFKVIRDLKRAGKAVVYISHRMNEVFELCDKITVMKDGAWVRTGKVEDFNLRSLVATMVGRELQNFFPSRAGETGDHMLEVSGLRLDAQGPTVQFSVKRGEILGLAGLEGQGQREIMRALVGVESAKSVSIRRRHADSSMRVVDVSSGFSSAISAGIGFIPEDRKQEGLFLRLPIYDNIALGKQLNRSMASVAWRSVSRVREIIASLRVAAADPSAPVGKLSGGNQQKVLLGRWLLSGVDILVIEEPTRGVDVGAKAEIYRLLRDFSERGGAVIVSSRELAELIGLCDNILIVHDRKIVGQTPAVGATEESILGTALGSHAAHDQSAAVH
ncbi:ABC transporter ATP-binding protein [Rhizobium sp. L9]|uniref:sugar ABC transporter ATP-binding protein n=1 Tax=Rhizobium TaxID=379 RepID=UPI000BEA75C0|nr:MULTISPECIES: sugar ABC transporter ATP-binding protein [unclassified Rhizobium]MDC9813186.1 sugar ABC transporter ATP-binding protein [Rhizobium sp. MC62]PDT27001.1 ABC transporter ATP-binding protein [Rhizobium sp. L9]